MNIFIAGLGYCGVAIAERLGRDGHAVWGLNRSGRSPDVCARAVAGDVLRPESLAPLAALPPMDLLVSALSGTGQADPAAYRTIYVDGPRRVADALAWAGPRRLWLLGSTGVYGGDDGGWVDEDTPVLPGHGQGEVQVEAEAALRAEADECCVLRLSGLYGPGRIRLVQQGGDAFLLFEWGKGNLNATCSSLG
jgi:nucleoside-diphosphate-sugar epimerase